MKTFEQLKDFMSSVKTVEQWNEKREQAKKEFSQELIYQLDGCGYIHHLRLKSEN